MRVQVRKSGSGASVRIPASVMAAAALRVDQEVDIREDGGRVVIEPVVAPTQPPTLDELLDAMRPETFHDLVDWGPPVGNEVW